MRTAIRNPHIAYIVDRFHVGTSNMAIVREFARRLPRKSTTKRQRKEVYRKALAIHADNRRLYNAVMSGRL